MRNRKYSLSGDVSQTLEWLFFTVDLIKLAVELNSWIKRMMSMVPVWYKYYHLFSSPCPLFFIFGKKPLAKYKLMLESHWSHYVINTKYIQKHFVEWRLKFKKYQDVFKFHYFPVFFNMEFFMLFPRAPFP